MLTCKITLPDSLHPVIRSISKNPGFRALYLARQNEFRFFSFNKYKRIFFIFGWCLLREKFGFCPINNGVTRVWGLQTSAPWLVHLCSQSRTRVKLNRVFFVRFLVSQKFPHVCLWATKSEGVGLIVRVISFHDFQPMWSQSTNVTDRPTCDRKTAL